jgi:hypothetical protein
MKNHEEFCFLSKQRALYHQGTGKEGKICIFNSNGKKGLRFDRAWYTLPIKQCEFSISDNWANHFLYDIGPTVTAKHINPLVQTGIKRQTKSTTPSPPISLVLCTSSSY